MTTTTPTQPATTTTPTTATETTATETTTGDTTTTDTGCAETAGPAAATHRGGTAPETTTRPRVPVTSLAPKWAARSGRAARGGAVAADARARRRRVVRLAVVLGVVAACCVASAPIAAPAWAQEAGVGVLAQAESIDQVLTNIRGWLMGILGALATVMATVGGIRYTMADGDPGEIQRAKTAFRSAGIGFALATLAPLLVTILQGVVGL